MSDDEQYLREVTKADFESALRKSFWHGVSAWLTQKSNDLLPFDEVRKHLPVMGSHDAGMREIPIDQIVGSVGRYRDFDRRFLPRRPNTGQRWMNIDRAHLQDVNLPPIEVYKIGEIYFVKDGNHRVSVARERGQKFIDAHVIEIHSPVPINRDTDLNELIRRKEEIDFLSRTRIKDLYPGAEIRLTIPGGYQKLEEHIRTHQWFTGEHRGASVPWTEAVKLWYGEVYSPMVALIRENDLLMEFPERTEADLYLWVVEHLHYLRESYRGRQVSMEEAVEHFVDEYTHDPLQRLVWTLRI